MAGPGRPSSADAERVREARGLVRWLRPDFQARGSATAQEALAVVADETAPAGPKAAKAPWPKTLPEQVQAIRGVLTAAPSPLGAEAIARRFLRAPGARIAEVLAALAALGQVRRTGDGRYTGA